MTKSLQFKGSNQTWYPISINSLEKHLSLLIKSNDYIGIDKTYPIRKNIAYCLQHLEFLDRVFRDISLSSVLWTQNIKSFVVNGASIIEAIFYYLVVSSGNASKTNWQSVKKFKTNEYQIHDDTFINENEIFIKVSPPIESQMTFDQLAKKVEKNKLLGESSTLYSKISGIRKLRNKIHIQGAEHSLDTDWWNFNQSQYQLIRNSLHSILTSSLFKDSKIIDRFDYLINES